MNKSFRKSLLCALVFASSAALANEAEMAAAVKRLFGMQAKAVRESLIPGLYGINTSASEVGPRFFVDQKLTAYGNFSTGYTHISGPRQGQDLSPQEAQELFRSMLAALPKDKLITYRFGSGSPEVVLFTAYDCPTCRAVEKELLQQAKQLDATVYMIPTALRYQLDPVSRVPVQSVLCAADREAAWQALILKGKAPATGRCSERADDYAYLSRAFPVKFPQSVPTAVALATGRIYPNVTRNFSEIFGGH